MQFIVAVQIEKLIYLFSKNLKWSYYLSWGFMSLINIFIMLAASSSLYTVFQAHVL